MARKPPGPSRLANIASMRSLGDRLSALRTGTMGDVLDQAEFDSSEELSDDWLRRLEEGSRVAVQPWELQALAYAHSEPGDAGGRKARQGALLVEFKRLAGWMEEARDA